MYYLLNFILRQDIYALSPKELCYLITFYLKIHLTNLSFFFLSFAKNRPWPYDRGFENNSSDVFGSKKKYWLLPLVSEEHRKRLLEETLDVVAVPLPEVSAWQGPLGGVNSGGGGGAAVNGGFSNSITSSPAGNLGHGPSPSNESVGSDLGMVLIERPIST